MQKRRLSNLLCTTPLFGKKILSLVFFRKNQTQCTNIFLPLLPDENKFHSKNGIIYIFIRDKMEDPI